MQSFVRQKLSRRTAAIIIKFLSDLNAEMDESLLMLQSFPGCIRLVSKFTENCLAHAHRKAPC